MSRIFVLALIGACASTVLASAQAAPSQTEVSQQIQTTRSPVAYVYVASAPTSGSSEINAYAVSSTGALTTVAGSPFASTASNLALTAHWLFGTNGIDIFSYSIASDGAIRQVDSYTAGTNYGGPVLLFLDHTGATLYDGYANLHGTDDNGYQSYTINKSTGKITLLNEAGSSPTVGDVLNFVGSNEYGYSSSCYQFTPIIYGFKRNSAGSLTELNVHPALPVPPANDFYCPYLAAADPTDHVAVPVQALNGSSFQPDGQPQIAVYTADSSGNLITASTSTNMPKTSVTSVTAMSMAPSGKLLAVGGTTGLQVFHFNGASQVSHYTGLLTGKQIDQMFWDNANHLYAISRSAGKLYVFTVTPTSYSQAAGSPHSMTTPEAIIVLPKT